MKTSNIKARQFVENKIPFTGNNLMGVLIHGCYVVYSYGYYPIHVFKDGIWYENTSKYSVTTSKHTSQTRIVIENRQYKTLKEMKALLYNRD